MSAQTREEWRKEVHALGASLQGRAVSWYFYLYQAAENVSAIEAGFTLGKAWWNATMDQHEAAGHIMRLLDALKQIEESPVAVTRGTLEARPVTMPHAVDVDDSGEEPPR